MFVGVTGKADPRNQTPTHLNTEIMIEIIYYSDRQKFTTELTIEQARKEIKDYGQFSRDYMNKLSDSEVAKIIKEMYNN